METMEPAVGVAQDVEVSVQARRRRFTAEYKRKILKEAKACSRPGEVGSLFAWPLRIRPTGREK